MKLDQFTSMLRKDLVVAGYGMAATVWRKGFSKVLGNHIGETGTNVASLAVGTALSSAALTDNQHLNSLGGALRIGSLVRMGNSVVESFIGSRKEDSRS